MAKTNSAPKKQVIDFIKNAEIDKEYQFIIKGTEQDAKVFVHCMRNELSRLRNEVKDRGYIPRHFKMMLHKIEQVADGSHTCKITLRKTTSAKDVTNEVDEIFGHLAGGQKIVE